MTDEEILLTNEKAIDMVLIYQSNCLFCFY